jgi:hypothetical protein
LGHYTLWLASAGFLGAIVFVRQIINITQGTGSGNFFDVTRVRNITDAEVQFVLFLLREMFKGLV